MVDGRLHFLLGSHCLSFLISWQFFLQLIYSNTWLNNVVLDCHIGLLSLNFNFMPFFVHTSLSAVSYQKQSDLFPWMWFSLLETINGFNLVLCIVLCLFQKELERARMEQACVTSEKQNLERQLMQQGSDHTELHTSYSDLEVSQLKNEIEACIRNSGSCILLKFQIQNCIFDRPVIAGDLKYHVPAQ